MGKSVLLLSNIPEWYWIQFTLSLFVYGQGSWGWGGSSPPFCSSPSLLPVRGCQNPFWWPVSRWSSAWQIWYAMSHKKLIKLKWHSLHTKLWLSAYIQGMAQHLPAKHLMPTGSIIQAEHSKVKHFQSFCHTYICLASFESKNGHVQIKNIKTFFKKGKTIFKRNFSLNRVA